MASAEDSRRLDRGPQARAERPSLHDKRPIVERRSLRSALRASVETTEIAACDSPARMTGREDHHATVSTTLPVALRDNSAFMASAPFSRGKRMEMCGFSLPSPYH